MGHLDPPQVFTGFFGAIALYNALVFFITRDKPFAWYAGLMASMFAIQGIFDPWLFGLPADSTDGGLFRTIALSAYFVCAVGFVTSYLHLREDLPRVDLLLKILLVMNLAGVALEFAIPPSFYHSLIDDTMLFAMLAASLWAGMRSASIGREDARFYVTAFAGAIAGLAVGDISEDFHMRGAWIYAFPGGVAWEALFLALALASRVRFATYDALTGVRNRRGFEEALSLAWREAAHARGALAVIMIDVNGFKPYNDRMGHPAGDALLRRIAHLCAACCRGRADTFARYGGDEFAAVLPGVSRSEAETVASRMRNAIEENCPVSICTGIASVEDGCGNQHDLVVSADSRLYREKQARSALPPVSTQAAYIH
ncbi:MAG TPA: diguanylate cyclase [Candidatus Baltobacteraceae bacterium]|jgi:diguanylate cyclase (GGDEF)-like protein|nr:diguanylate cyclase [Candidatus Baltobacteraceae bacterium]